MERLSDYTRTVSSVPKGLVAGRYAKALAIAKGDILGASAFASSETWDRWRTTPGVATDLKAAVAAMSTGDAGGLAASNAISDFLGLVRARSLIDRIAGWHRVPMNTSTLVFSGDISASIVGEGQPKPLSKFSMERVTLIPTKVPATIVISDEVLRHADPAVELSIGTELAAALTLALDTATFDPNRTGSIANGATVINSTGFTLAQIDADLKSMLAYFATQDSGLDGAVWVMSATTAAYLAALRGTGGDPAFPLVNLRSGGSIWGIPVFISGALRATGSPGESAILLLDPRQVLLADEGKTEISIARSASIQMDGAPGSGATQETSLWQHNLIGIRAERWFAVKRASDTAVIVLDNFQIG